MNRKYIIGISLLVACLFAVSAVSAADSTSDRVDASDHDVVMLGTQAWSATINVDDGTFIKGSDWALMGEATDANDGPPVDGHDVLHPPLPPAPYAQCYFADGLPSPYHQLYEDWRFFCDGADTSWYLTVASSGTLSGSGNTMNITWNSADFSSPCEYATVYLRDTVSGGILVDMLTVSSYSYAVGAVPQFDFFTITCENATCPLLGENCFNPYQVDIDADLDYFVSHSTIGFNDDYSSTDLGTYDNGYDTIYMLNVATDTMVDIIQTSTGSTWSGIGLFDDCPDVGNLLASDTGSMLKDEDKGTKAIEDYVLLASESPYYLMCDNWPTPDGYDYDLLIHKVHDVGVTEINAPPDICYAENTYPVNVTVCNWGNDETSIPVHVVIENVTAKVKGDTVLLSEDYESFSPDTPVFPPTGWTISGVSSETWEPYVYSGDETARCYETTGELQDEWMETDTIDCSGSTGVTFSYEYRFYRSTYSGDSDGWVYGSTDDGATYDQIIAEYHLTASSSAEVIDISSWADGESQVKIAFRFNSSDATSAYDYFRVHNATVYDSSKAILMDTSFDDVIPGSGWPINGWTHEIVSGTDTDNEWDCVDGVTTSTHPSGVLPYGGTYMLQYDSYYISDFNSARIYSPAMDFSVYNTENELTFWMNHDSGYSSSDDRIEVQASTDGSSWTTLETISRYNSTAPGWLQHTIDLDAYNDEPSVYIGFLATSDYGNSIYIDDVEVTGTEYVPGPGGVIVYDETVYVDIEGDTKGCEYVNLPDWDGVDVTAGNFTVTACTELPTDDNNANNCSVKDLVVLSGEHDVGVVSIDEPSGNILEGLHTVEATVENFGDFDEVDVLVKCSVYEILDGDDDDDDDDDDDYCSDFEADDGGWVPTADWDPIGDWEWTNTYDVSNYVGTHTPPPTAYSGTGLWGTVIYDDYTNAGGESWLKQTFDFSGMTNTQLTFNSWVDAFGSWDYGRVMVNGAELARYDTYNPTSWTNEVISLAAYDNNPSVEINFAFYATTVVEYAGWYIDDVCITADAMKDVGSKDAAIATYNLIYTDTELVDLLEGEQKSIAFTPQVLLSQGMYAINVTTMLPTDNHPENDSQNITIEVVIPNVYNVEKNWWYNTIQDAVDDADPGNTLQAKPLIFEENVEIPMEVTLMPYGEGMPILKGNEGIGFYVTGDDVVISEFEITNCSNGVYLEGCVGTTIRNSTIYYNLDAGIYLAGASEYSIVYNHIYGNAVGIATHPASTPLPPPKSKDQLLFEDFDGTWVADSDGDLAPVGWEVEQYNSLQWWHQDTFDSHSGAYSAALFWDYDPQDEWIITPSIDLSTYINTELTYWTYGYFGSTYSDHYYVKVSTDGGSSWTIEHDQTDDYPPDQGWNYYASPIIVDLSAYDGMSDVKVAFHGDGIVSVGMWYYWLIDDVEINADLFGGSYYTLDVTIVGDGTVIKDPDMTDYPEDTVVELTAIADPGWTFSGWSGDLSGDANPETIIMDDNKFVTATFEVDLSGEGGIHYNRFGNIEECETPGIAIINFIEDGAIPDARWNWYGAPDGPGGDTIDAITGRIADGFGEEVFGPLNFDPWAGLDAIATASATDVILGDPITFSAVGSFAAMMDGTYHPVAYLWSFEDGTFSAEETIGHTYEEVGTYPIYLRVSSNDADLWPGTMYDWAYMTITVMPPDMPLTANADANNFGSYEGTTDYPVQFYGAAIGGTPPYSFEWNFNDGTNPISGRNIDHYFDEPGTYTATLTVSDSEGSTATDTAIVTIYGTDELVANAGGPYDGVASEVIYFSGSATGGNLPYTYEWSFGDGATSNGQYVQHAYDSDGVYTVTLKVTDANEEVDEHTTTVTVNKGESAEIRDVKGGIGVKATIKAGETPTSWEITIDGKYVFGTTSSSGTIDEYEVETVKSPFTIGLGRVDISVMAGAIVEEYTAFMIGPFVLAVK